MKKVILSIALFTAVLVSANNQPINVNPITYSKTVSVNAFCKLIQMGDYDAVKSLIKNGEDINKKSVGLTPLMYAARHNKAAIAKLLIESGAKLKLKSDMRNMTALKWAKISGAKDSYKVLKDAIETQKALRKKRK